MDEALSVQLTLEFAEDSYRTAHETTRPDPRIPGELAGCETCDARWSLARTSKTDMPKLLQTSARRSKPSPTNNAGCPG